jgi:hypothetical protein
MNTHSMRLPSNEMLRPWEKLARLRDIAPLVHNITNYVVPPRCSVSPARRRSVASSPHPPWRSVASMR